MARASTTLFVLLSVSFVIAPTASSQQPGEIPLSQYKVDRWSPANGSPFNGVNALTQTRDGYLWIGSNEGLYRFDGVRFVEFNRVKYPNLLSTRISALFEDSKGSLWIGTQGGRCRRARDPGGGLSILRNGRVSTITSNQGLPSDYVKAIAEDSLGAIWVGTDGEGVCKVVSDSIITYNHKNTIIDGRVTSIAIDRENGVWVGTFGGLFRFSNDHWSRFGKKDGLSTDSVLSLHVTNDKVWIGTFGHGIMIFSNGVFGAFNKSVGENVTGILGDTKGAVWVITLREGVSRVLHGEVSSRSIEGTDRGAYGMSCARSTDGSIWVGLQIEGLVRFREVPFKWYSTGSESQTSAVASVTEDHGGTIWLGTTDGLERLAQEKIVPTSLNNVNVISVAEGPERNLWVGTLGKGLYKFSKGHGSRIDLNGVAAIWALYSTKNALWAGSNNGLVRIENGTTRVYRHNTNGLSHDDVRAVCMRSDSTIWIGTSYGLDELVGDTFKVYTKKNSNISNDVVIALYADDSGDLWIGTVGGLNRLRGQTFVSFTTRDGLPDDAAGMILEDNDGYLWIASDRGL